MSLLSTWIADERGARLWMASDSRLSAEGRSLIDECVKIFEVLVVCRSAASGTGDFTNPHFANTFALGCVGNSLIYQQIQANLSPLLGNLIGPPGAVPSLAQIADFTATIGTRYVRSLGVSRPESASLVQLIVAGWCPIEGSYVAYELHPVAGTELIAFKVSPVDLSKPHFAGDKIDAANELCARIMADDRAGASATRAPLNVLRSLIEDPEAPTIGGDVQVGFTLGPSFRRVQTVRPVPGHAPQAAFWMNAIRTDELPPIGPCILGLMGSVSP